MLAEKLGMSDRHVRRLFHEHLGASPIEIITTNRLHLAKHFIENSRLSMVDVSIATGFQSVRRFNEAFKSRYRKSPSEIRREGKTERDGINFQIPIRLPYDWSHVVAFLERHETYGLEHVDGDKYTRFISQGNSFGVVTISFNEKKGYLDVRFVGVELQNFRPVLAKIKGLFDADHNPLHLPGGTKVETNGIRVVGSFDALETSVSIILGQLVSTAHAKSIMKRLVVRFGKKIGVFGDKDVFAFPTASVLSNARIEELGVTKTKARAIRELAGKVISGEINFNSYAAFEEVRGRLLDIRGIGNWTTEVILMRCFGDPAAFPETDLIIERFLGKKNFDREKWKSHYAYLVHTLWRDSKKNK